MSKLAAQQAKVSGKFAPLRSEEKILSLLASERKRIGYGWYGTKGMQVCVAAQAALIKLGMDAAAADAKITAKIAPWAIK